MSPNDKDRGRLCQYDANLRVNSLQQRDIEGTVWAAPAR